MTLTIILYLIICILTILLVIMQQGAKGMGLMSGGSDTILGSNEGNVLTKATNVLAVLFVVGALILSILGVERSVLDADNEQGDIKPAGQTAAPVKTKADDKKGNQGQSEQSGAKQQTVPGITPGQPVEKSPE
ncbi:MAG TPA: preprotein translocase subunit SecG [Spirochaetota bacterium]|nr:preprotein translocase subunit SecG [Spirochaetota bacterium]